MGTREAQKNYRDNWERTFGKKQDPEPERESKISAEEIDEILEDHAKRKAAEPRALSHSPDMTLRLD